MPSGIVKLDRMRIAQREADHLALELGAIPDAHDVHILLEPCRDAVYGVGHQSARQAVQRRLIVGLADGVQLRALLLEGDSPGQIYVQLALGPLHFDRTRRDLNLHSRGHGNRFSSNS